VANSAKRQTFAAYSRHGDSALLPLPLDLAPYRHPVLVTGGGHGRPGFTVGHHQSGKIEVAFDHLQIVRGAVERVRVDLDLTSIATPNERRKRDS